MAAELNVLMMGGQRVGKSSALAAMLCSLTEGRVADCLLRQGWTVSQDQELVDVRSDLKAQRRRLEELLAFRKGNTILVDTGKTDFRRRYTVHITGAECPDALKLTFVDVNGEFYDSYGVHAEEVDHMVDQADVVVVAVDTPFMMAAKEKSEPMVPKRVHTAINCTESVHTFLTQVDDRDGKDPKLVIFVPLKCEKWSREGRLNDVRDAVKEAYRDTIRALTSFKAIRVEILPVQTTGSLVFKDFGSAHLYQWESGIMGPLGPRLSTRCSRMPDGKIRLETGNTPVANGRLLPDSQAVLDEDSGLMRPNAWFQVMSDQYMPHHCEQLTLHVLDFYFQKIIETSGHTDSQTPSGFFASLRKALVEGRRPRAVAALQSFCQQIRKEGILKTNSEGIALITNTDAPR